MNATLESSHSLSPAIRSMIGAYPQKRPGPAISPAFAGAETNRATTAAVTLGCFITSLHLVNTQLSNFCVMSAVHPLRLFDLLLRLTVSVYNKRGCRLFDEKAIMYLT